MFRNGSYVLVIGSVLILAVIAWRAPGILAGLDSRAVGDGADPASYGFDLAALNLPTGELVASGMPRDGLSPLDDPPTMTPDEADQIPWGGHGHGTFLVSGSRVVGVELDGEARAYPLSVLNWHEVVNDTLGGSPITIAYNPLADSACAFARDVEGGASRFGFSGLLHQSSALLHVPEGDGSLWSPLLGIAVSGPSVGQPLEPIRASLVRWADWLERHPDTSILAPDLTRKRIYKRKPYESYRGSDRLRFPVDPLPGDDLPNKTPVIGVEQGGERAAYTVEGIHERAGEDGSWITEQGGQPLTFETGESPSVFVAADPDARVVYCYRFAWYALYPDAPIL